MNQVHLMLETPIICENFPVKAESLPKLTAYSLKLGGGNLQTIGGKLSYRFRKMFGGHWVYTNWKLITDTPQGIGKLNSVLSDLWGEQNTVFRDLQRILEEPTWVAGPAEQADFVAKGLYNDIEPIIDELLLKEKRDLGAAIIERYVDQRSWVVGGQPSISISIFSNLVHKQDLNQYCKSIKDRNQIVGLLVSAKNSNLKGEIVSIEGTLADHRQRLMKLAQEENSKKFMENAPDNELVVKVKVRRDQPGYDYIASALRLVVRVQDFARFGINGSVALKALKISPVIRSKIVETISNHASLKPIIGPCYSSKTHPSLFMDATKLNYSPMLKIGSGHIFKLEETFPMMSLKRYGLYQKSDKFIDKPLKIGILNGLNSESVDTFTKRLLEELQSLNFNATISGTTQLKALSRSEIEKGIESLWQNGDGCNIIVSYLPDEYGNDDEEASNYHAIKSIGVSRKIPSQVIYKNTLEKKYAMGNIVLGVLGKTGNVPFALATPLQYADMVVGIDIARLQKKQLTGSINATAMARIYFSDGKLLRYVISDAPLEGETIPRKVLESLFPAKEFTNKKIVIHRDGFFRGKEKEALTQWAKELGSEFYLVEVIKSGAPRLYAQKGDIIDQALKGSTFRLSDTEAFMVSSLPPFKDATAMPIHIRTYPPFTIENAIHSVLSLTLLHYGSLRQPKLPVTIHYSDKIAGLALQGIKPKDLEGTDPFWL